MGVGTNCRPYILPHPVCFSRIHAVLSQAPYCKWRERVRVQFACYVDPCYALISFIHDRTFNSISFIWCVLCRIKSVNNKTPNANGIRLRKTHVFSKLINRNSLNQSYLQLETIWRNIVFKRPIDTTAVGMTSLFFPVTLSSVRGAYVILNSCDEFS